MTPSVQLLGFSEPVEEQKEFTIQLNLAGGCVTLRARRCLFVGIAKSILTLAGEQHPRAKKKRRRHLAELEAAYQRGLEEWKAGSISQREVCEKYKFSRRSFEGWLFRKRKLEAQSSRMGENVISWPNTRPPLCASAQ